MPLETTSAGLLKAPTGITGFDEISQGGLPAGRPTLICGSAGSGKTLFAATFLVQGATRCNEPGVFMSFEERSEDLAANFVSLGYDLGGLVAAGQVVVDHVQIERSEIEEAGEYDLEGLFVRLGYAVDSIGAKRVVLDTLEALFASFTDPGILRAELRRLFGWLKDRGLTAVITAERGEGQLTRQGLEEYVSDCVILLDNRVEKQVATRRLRIVKYRGSSHGSNEYPFLIDDDGISVLPITTARRRALVSNETVSTGIAGLDAMLRGGGFYRGSSVFVSGISGTGKTNLANLFIDAACRRGERCMAFLLEEGADETVRNARSIGIDLEKHVEEGLLRFDSSRPTLYGLETHLARMHRDIEAFRPDVVVVDPISAFRGPEHEVHSTLLRMVDLLKGRGITAMFTSLRHDDTIDHADLGLSSLMDSWIKLMDVESNGERNRTLYVIKSRGMSHSNQVREYHITDHGVHLTEPYVGGGRVLTGTARQLQEEREQADATVRLQEAEQRRRTLARRRESTAHQIAVLEATLAADEEEQRTLAREQAELGGELPPPAPQPRRPPGGRQMSGPAEELADSDGGHYHLRLYVAGSTPRSLAALRNLQRVCDDHLAGRFTIEVIDLRENPRLAAGDQILAIPTLVRRLPARSSGSSGTCRTPRSCWSAWTSVRATHPHDRDTASPGRLPAAADRRGQHGAVAPGHHEPAPPLRRAPGGPRGPRDHRHLPAAGARQHLPGGRRTHPREAAPAPRPPRHRGPLPGGSRAARPRHRASLSHARQRQRRAGPSSPHRRAGGPPRRKPRDAGRHPPRRGDAIVIGDPASDGRVYTLESADRPYRVLIEQMQEAALTLGPDGIVLYCNRRTADLLHVPQEQVVGTRLQAFLSPADADLFARLQHVAGEGAARGEVVLHPPHAHPVAVGISVSSIHDGANHVLCAVLTDLTEHKRLLHHADAVNTRLVAEIAERERVEAALRQAQKMQAIGQLTGGIAHDFNNMLQAMAGGVELMRRRIEAGRPDEALGFVEATRQSIDRAASLTQRLLAFSRRQTLVARSIDPAALLAEIGSLARQTIDPSIALELAADAGGWSVLCDPNQLENALLNLVINARDAMAGHGGTIRLSATRATLSEADTAGWPASRPGEHVRFTVADTGSGMSAAVQAQAFEPFFTTKPLGQGTGLGLSQVHGFVAQSSGIVRIESAPSQGTAVHIELPRDHPHPAHEAEPSGHLPPRTGVSGARALVVEDEPDLRHLFAEAMLDVGCHPLAAWDGASGLAALQTALAGAEAIDILVADVGLPGGMNGRQLADAARELLPGLPVLLMTGFAGEIIGPHDPLPPGIEVIRKPFALDLLMERMARLLEHSA